MTHEEQYEKETGDSAKVLLFTGPTYYKPRYVKWLKDLIDKKDKAIVERLEEILKTMRKGKKLDRPMATVNQMGFAICELKADIEDSTLQRGNDE